ncbi:MAG: MATE family efflux transporter [Acutalibacteraceae bacterium]
MTKEKSFFKTVCALAVPVALQSMLQASFSIVDQIMIGQLGSVSVAGVGLAGKFSSVFSVLVSAIGAVAGIMIAQYLGQKNKREVSRSFFLNLLISLGIAGVFTVLCIVLPQQIMGLYTQESDTVLAAADYLSIISFTFLPMAGATLLSTLYRCIEKASLPLVASIVSACLNTGLNYILIFGKFGTTPMGAQGAAIATVIAQIANLAIMLLFLVKYKEHLKSDRNQEKRTPFNWKQYAVMLLPVLVCELLRSIGENVYAAIYGHLGTQACAAMTLINPIQGLMIGALCGLSQAAGIIIGKKLGNKDHDDAYSASKKLILYGLVGSVVLSLIIVLTSPLYVEIYQVEDTVKLLTRQILLAYAIIAPFKVLNMIVSGGIIRSGGKTKYVMMIDIIGTWCFGVPLGLLAAFVFNLSIPYVYFILSLEECVRFGISLVVLKRKKWMNSLEA